MLETSSGYEHVDFITKCLNECDMKILVLTYSLDFDYVTEFNNIVKSLGVDNTLKTAVRLYLTDCGYIA